MSTLRPSSSRFPITSIGTGLYLEAVIGVVALTAILALALWPAIHNGFPLVYDDTNVYIGSIRDYAAPYPIFYSAVVSLISEGIGLYAVPVAQAVLTVYVVQACLRLLVPEAAWLPRILVIPVLLAVSQLPWLVSWLTPDLMGGLGALSVIALTLSPPADRPGRIHAAALGGVALLACLMATSNILLLLPFGAGCWLLRRFLAGNPLPGRAIILGLAFAFLALVTPVAVNVALHGKPTLATGSAARLFAKLTDERLAQRYLHLHCAGQQHDACAYLERLDALDDMEGFLWTGAPTLAKETGAWLDLSGEYGRLSRQIVLANIPEVVRFILRDTAVLLGRVTMATGPGREIVSHADPADAVRRRIVERYPQLLPAFDAARQQSGALRASFPERAYVVSCGVSYAACVLILIISLAKGRRQDAALALAVLLLIVLGAVVHGGLAVPISRYHVKLSWIAWLLPAVLVLRWAERRALPVDKNKLVAGSV
jgi:hypothetical protein